MKERRRVPRFVCNQLAVNLNNPCHTSPPALINRITNRTAPLNTVYHQLFFPPQERNVDASAYSQSMIVKTSAPTELGTLRKADGDEGFAGPAKA